MEGGNGGMAAKDSRGKSYMRHAINVATSKNNIANETKKELA
jgi:hypothetical protein